MNALDYLRIFSPYADSIGQVHWSPDGDAVLGGDGATLVLAGELAQYLEGFASQAELIHFAHQLHILHVLRWGPLTSQEALKRAQAAYSLARAGTRNAGVFFAHVTAGAPRLPGGIDAHDVCRRLRGIHSRPQSPSIRGLELLPTIDAASFERLLAESLNDYTLEELQHWFRHGRGSVREAAKAIAREFHVDAPRTLNGVIESLLQRGRLSGAEPLIEQLVSALTLPPRRMEPDMLPVGGYSGIGTRGHPDQILPSEFAVDELEFLRRYAENELLYYRREQPRKRLREELVVLVDQGVRTWGDVRIVLCASALALGQLAARRNAGFAIAGTANGGAPVDPTQAGVETVAEVLEASDLSPSPALALEHLLEADALKGVIEQSARDVIVLTHPRSLEGDLALASRRANPDTRVFSISVDGEGHVAVNQYRHGALVTLSAFKVDLARGAASRAMIALAESDCRPWKGSIEPLGFPFAFAAPHGLECLPLGFALAFDADGKWLATAARGSLVHVYPLDGSRCEIMPRGTWRGRVLDSIETLVGVAGGFAACGTISGQAFVVHYDLIKRQATIHALRPSDASRPRCFGYDSSVHAICVTTGGSCLVLDLASGAVVDSPHGETPLAGAWHRASQRHLQAPRVEVRDDDAKSPPRPVGVASPASIAHSPSRGSLQFGGAAAAWRTPLLDGRPLLAQSLMVEAQQVSDCLVVKTSRTGKMRLHVLRGEELIHQHELEVGATTGNYLLHDSHLLAICQPDESVRVLDLDSGPRQVMRTSGSKCHNELFFEVGNFALSVYGGKFTHILRWDHGKLEATHRIGHVAFTQGGRRPGVIVAPELIGIHVNAQTGRPPMLSLAPERFHKFAVSPAGLFFVSDTYGQLFVLEPDGAVVVAFFIYRATVAAWLPDGTRYGPSSITGAATSPDALGRVGRALRDASQRALGATSTGGRLP